jgi:hypothetical protein
MLLVSCFIETSHTFRRDLDVRLIDEHDREIGTLTLSREGVALLSSVERLVYKIPYAQESKRVADRLLLSKAGAGVIGHAVRRSDGVRVGMQDKTSEVDVVYETTGRKQVQRFAEFLSIWIDESEAAKLQSPT